MTSVLIVWHSILGILFLLYIEEALKQSEWKQLLNKP